MADIEIISPLISESSVLSSYDSYNINIHFNVNDLLRSSNNIDFLNLIDIFTEINSNFLIVENTPNINTSLNSSHNIQTNDCKINLSIFTGISSTSSKIVTITKTSNGVNIITPKILTVSVSMKSNIYITRNSYVGYITINSVKLGYVYTSFKQPFLYTNNSYNSEYFINIDFNNDGEFIDTEIDNYSNLIIKGGNV